MIILNQIFIVQRERILARKVNGAHMTRPRLHVPAYMPYYPTYPEDLAHDIEMTTGLGVEPKHLWSGDLDDDNRGIAHVCLEVKSGELDRDWHWYPPSRLINSGIYPVFYAECIEKIIPNIREGNDSLFIWLDREKEILNDIRRGKIEREEAMLQEREEAIIKKQNLDNIKQEALKLDNKKKRAIRIIGKL